MRIDDEFCKKLPLEPSAELIEFIKSKPAFNTHAIVYRIGYHNGQKVASCHCTACNKDFYQEYVSAEHIPNTYSHCTFGFRNSEFQVVTCGKSETVCPECGTPVKVYHISDFGKHDQRIELAGQYFLTVEVVDGAVCLLVWTARRKLHKDGKVSLFVYATESNIYTRKNKKRITPYGYAKWHVLSKYYTTLEGISSENIYPFKDEIFIGTDFENAKLEKYLSSGRCYPMLYCLLYREHPNIENLVMAGASFFVNERISVCNSYYYGFCMDRLQGIDFSENKPSKMVGLTKDEFKIFKENQLSYDYLLFYFENKKRFSLDDLCFFHSVCSFHDLRNIIRAGYSPYVVCRYLKKQKERSGSIVNYVFLRDYWELSKKVGIPITDKNRFPKNLKGLHDNFVSRIKQEEDNLRNKQYEERFDELSKFSFEKGGLLIRPCASDTELFNEGKKLDHCVYTYAKSHCEGRTAIFFIREKEKPDKPYYTLEFNEKSISVKQNHGYKNDMNGTKPKPHEVEEFVKLWLKRCKEIKEKENGKSSSKSKSRVSASA